MTEQNANPYNNEENVKDVNLLLKSDEEISIYDLFSKSKRKLIVACVTSTAFIYGFSDAACVPLISTIAIDLNTTVAFLNLSISLYLLSAGIASLIWGVISDRWGRNLPMRIGLALFLISSIGWIFSVNIEMLTLLGTCQSISMCVTVVVGQSILADIYPAEKRGFVMRIFSVILLIGVAIGPTVSGIIAYYFQWRVVFIFVSVFTLIILIIYVFITPETHQYYLMIKTKNKKIIERDQILKPVITNPFVSFTYFIDLSIVPFLLSASTAFTTIVINQCLLGIIESKEPYSYNDLEIGLSYIPLSVGDVLASLVGGYCADQGNKFFRANTLENRLIPGTIGYILIPIGLIAYGWTLQYGLNICIPLISATVVAFGQAVYRPGVSSYLTIKEQQHSAAVLPANTSLNYIFAAITLSVAARIIKVIDLGPFFTIMALINIIAIIPSIFIIRRNTNLSRKNYQAI